MRNKGIIVVLLLILAVTRNGLTQTVPWSVQVTGNNQTIFVPKSLVATIDNGTLASGDVIAVFYSVQGVLKCGGLVEWKGNDTFLIAYGDDGSQNGFQPNETFVFKIWRKAQNCILESVTTQFAEPDQVLITSKDLYKQDGISQIDQFSAFVPSFWLGKDTSICQGDSVRLKPSLKNGSFLWSTNSTANYLDVKTADKYWLKYTNTNNCAVSDTIIITINQLDLSSLKTSVANATCKMAGLVHIDENTIKGRKPFQYTITNDLTGQTTETQANTITLSDGVNLLSIQDANGCIAQCPTPINIARAENCKHPVLAPDSQGEFSSFYIPYSSGIAKIYDRCGKLKKQIHLPANWDGKDESGNIVPMGDYYIVCEGEKSLTVTVIK